ncbi:ABC transporter permease [Saxibacter everestensis]|uniref:ABC transporter permease n=1 Tax=Saxibacter everestensis TaxID=2909229 RepID=A0ABY8QSN5_9MICO|nr:ABC transporter permease [Brevibacteriaceae bacterium ZFBP1038]
MKHKTATQATLWTYSVLVAIWLIAPTLIVIPLSFTDKASLVFPPTGWSTRWYEKFFTDPTWMTALGNSFTVAVIVVIISTLIGTAAALGLHRWTRRNAAAVVQAGLLAPVVVPAIILAIGIYSIFLKFQLLGTVLGFVLAHSVLAMPFVVISVTAALANFDERLETAAASLGAGKWPTFFKVTLPLIIPGVVSGALFAFVTSFDEVVLSIFIKSPYLETLPVKMYGSVTRDTDPTIAAAATMIMLITTVIIVIGLLSMNRKKRVR